MELFKYATGHDESASAHPALYDTPLEDAIETSERKLSGYLFGMIAHSTVYFIACMSFRRAPSELSTVMIIICAIGPQAYAVSTTRSLHHPSVHAIPFQPGLADLGFCQ